MTEAMKEIMVKIMVEVLGIFAIMTKEIKQGRASEPISDHRFLIVDRDSEKYLKKYLKKLIGGREIEDALIKLEKLTQDEVKLAAALTLKLAQQIKGGVEGVGVEVRGVGEKVNEAIAGTFSALATHQWHLKPTYD